MHFAFTDEQAMIAETAKAFFAEQATSERTRTAMAASGVDQALWQAFTAELGLAGVAIPEAEGLAPGGAKLLVLRPTAAKSDYATPWQPPFDDERREAFLSRIRAAVSVMRGTTFTAPYEEHCRDDHSYGLCRIHTIGAVSAS